MSAQGYGLAALQLRGGSEKERWELEMLRARQVDGIVLASAHVSGNTDMLKKIRGRRLCPGDDRPRRSSARPLPPRADRRRWRSGASPPNICSRTAAGAIAHIGGPPIVHAQTARGRVSSKR